MIKHYVYYSYEEFGRGYIGKHKIDYSKGVSPETDGYFGSFLDKTFRPTSKEILGIYDTEEEAYQVEEILQRAYSAHKNPDFANRSIQKSSRFFCDRTGVPHTPQVKEQIAKTMKEIRKDPEKIEKYSKIFDGEKNPNYGKCIRYDWINQKTGQKQLGLCPNHLATKYGLDVGSVSKVARGKCSQTKGWSVMSCQSTADSYESV